MAVITGNLTDFQGAPLAPAGVRIKFTPSTAAAGGSALLAAKPIYAAVDAAGAFTVGLIANESLYPPTYYSIGMEWPDPNAYSTGNGYIGFDQPDWKIIVPLEGGTIANLLVTSPSALDVWVGETDNPTYRFWYQPSTALLKR